MGSLPFMQWSLAVTGLVFIFALGAIVGSFINVLVYRMPRGLNVVTPPSRCPACETKLTWRENVPIVGWIALRGRCRFCRSPISAEYPIVELVVALLFAALYVMWFMSPSLVELAGVSTRSLRPDWAAEGLARTWPMFGLVLTLVASLVAMTIIDARTFMIPLALAWVPLVTGVVAHPAHALWLSFSGGLRRSTHLWTIPVVEGPWLGAALGGGAGLLAAVALLRVGLLPRSFADYEAWEKEALAKAEAERAAAPADAAAPSRLRLGPVLVRTALFTGPAIALGFVGMALGERRGVAVQGLAVGMGVGLLVGLLLRRLGPADSGDSGDPVWVRYPHARREMLKEALFLVPVAALGAVGWLIAERVAPAASTVGTSPVRHAPLWLLALGGSLAGALIGGGVVWLCRILGSLAFGKEAMGLGDVHLMAGVGAVMGWIDPALAFFIAPVFGIGAALMSLVLSRWFKRMGQALPFGPSLAVATLLIIYARPLVEAALSAILRQPVDLP